MGMTEIDGSRLWIPAWREFWDDFVPEATQGEPFNRARSPVPAGDCSRITIEPMCQRATGGRGALPD